MLAIIALCLLCESSSLCTLLLYQEMLSNFNAIPANALVVHKFEAAQLLYPRVLHERIMRHHLYFVDKRSYVLLRHHDFFFREMSLGIYGKSN